MPKKPRRKLNQEVYNDLVTKFAKVASKRYELGLPDVDFHFTEAKQVRKKQIQKLQDKIEEMRKENRRERDRQRREKKKETASQDQYAELVYNQIMGAINQVGQMSQRRGYTGYLVLSQFIQENYTNYGTKFIIAISESPMFPYLTNAMELYHATYTDEMAEEFIFQLGESLGVDMNDTDNYDFGVFFEEDDPDYYDED